MKSQERLKESYDFQKKIFDEAEDRRVSNAVAKKKSLEEKVISLQKEIQLLEQRIQNRREFESFESFRSRSSTSTK
jgi:uncharacterized protein YlxW (UPF0749 family)